MIKTKTEIWLAVISGTLSLIAAICSAAVVIITNLQKRRWEKEDRKEKEEEESKKKEAVKIEALVAGQKWLLYDRIKYLGLAYIKAGHVDFDDRRILREMHTVYHQGLGGNGDLDKIMSEVDKLPLKEGGS